MAAGRRKAHHKRRRGYHLSAQARAHMSAARKGKRHPHRGHPLSAATRAKISKALRGRHHKGHPGKGHKAGHHRRRQHQQRRRPRNVLPRRLRYQMVTKRIKVGARRGFFRHEHRVAARHHRFMTNYGRLRRHSFFRRRR
jgi:hypothetical protein